MKKFAFRFLTITALLILAACSLFNLGSGAFQLQADSTAVSATLTAISSGGGAVISTSSPSTSVAPSVEPGSNVPFSLGHVRVVFVDDNKNLGLWDEGASPVQLVSTGDITQALISPDGSSIAYVRSPDENHQTIWAVQNDGSNQRQVIGPDFFSQLTIPQNGLAIVPSIMAWVPGTLNLIFNTRATMEMGSSPLDDLWIVNTSTASYHNLRQTGSGGNFSISPDGKKVAVILPTSISILTLDDSQPFVTPLTYTAMITYSEGQYYPSPVWSADSTRLRVCIPPNDPLANPNEMTLSVFEVPTDGSAAVLLKTFQVRPFSKFELSPDLTLLAYLTTEGDPSLNQENVHIVNISNGTDTVIGTYSANQLIWVPNSAAIAIQALQPDSTLYVGLQPLQAGNLTEFPSVINVSFIDASRFVFLHPTGGGFELREGILSPTNPPTSILISNLPSGTQGWIPSYSFTK